MFQIPAIAESELLHRAVQIGLDRTNGEHETVGNLGVAGALRGELRQLSLEPSLPSARKLWAACAAASQA